MSYAQQSDIENIFSPDNVAAWSLYETGSPSGGQWKDTSTKPGWVEVRLVPQCSLTYG